MGELEISLKKEIRLGKLQKVILGTIATAGILAVTAVAPNVFQAIKLFGGKDILNRSKRESINKSRRKLVRLGLLAYDERGYLSITKEGKKCLYRGDFRDQIKEEPKKWDKKWRVIIFDIKEEKKYLRDKIRNTLIGIGFTCLQKSVWIYPYDCEDFITLLKADFQIGKDVLYMIVERLENDKELLDIFGLKR
jgi:hypothetical protein